MDLIGIFYWSSKDNEMLLLDLGSRVTCSDYSRCRGLKECRQNKMETGKSVNCSSSALVVIQRIPDGSVERVEKAMAPTPVLSPGKSHGWRSLVGCSPWGH